MPVMTPQQMQKMMAWQGLSSGLMGLGGGLMSAGMGNRQGIQQGLQGFGQATDPMKIMQAQYMQQQMANMEAKRKQAALSRAGMSKLTGLMTPQPGQAPGAPGPGPIASRSLPEVLGTPEGMAALTQYDPKLALQYGMKTPEAPKTVTAYDEATGRQVTRKWDPTQGRFVDVGGTKTPEILDPEVEAARKRIAQAGASKMSVTQVSEREQAKKIGGYYGDEFIRMQDSARSAREQNTRMDAMEGLFERTYTGAFAPTLQEARKVASALGVEGLEEAIASGEAGQAMADELALQLRNPAGGAGMPGSVSDADRRFLQGMTGGLATTKEGRQMMFEVKRRLNKRNIEIAQDARAYIKEKGELDMGFYDRIESKYGGENLFEDLQDTSTRLGRQEGVQKPVTLGGKRYEKVGDTWYEIE